LSVNYYDIFNFWRNYGEINFIHMRKFSFWDLDEIERKLLKKYSIYEQIVARLILFTWLKFFLISSCKRNCDLLKAF
jgi:hypothetical protein